jgi:hypothetical protein
MEYDEIDQFVDQLFRDSEDRGGGDGEPPINGEVLSGDWRIDRIDQIIQDTYDEAIWWHNQRISEGTDPRSGLRSLPYIPWDERIDGAAAMMGAAGGAGESSYARNGYSRAATASQTVGQAWDSRGLGIAGVLLVIALCIMTCAGMMLFDGTIGFVR